MIYLIVKADISNDMIGEWAVTHEVLDDTETTVIESESWQVIIVDACKISLTEQEFVAQRSTTEFTTDERTQYLLS